MGGGGWGASQNSELSELFTAVIAKDLRDKFTRQPEKWHGKRTPKYLLLLSKDSFIHSL